jgi:glutamate--cysteine ligase catalytic subunit
MKSIRERRGEKVKILIPLYQDKDTNMCIPTSAEPYPGQIYMDAMAFGMGCSCLQVTFESQSLNHARYVHDQLLPFTPILAAISASAPIFKGKLADIDMRWTVISQSVDCRTEEERNPESEKYIPKSRYSSINHYISNHQYVRKEYFDTVQYKPDPEHLKMLTEQSGLDERLAFHIGSLFVRDPVPTFDFELDE